MNILGIILSLFTPLIAVADDALYVAAAAAIIGAAIKTGVAIHNAKQAKSAKRAADRTIGGLNAENASNYYSDYYRSALDNDSTRAYLKRLDSAMKKNNQALDNTIVSTGATNENALAQRQARNEVTSNAIAGAVQAEDARKRALQNNYFARKQGLTLQQMQNDQAYRAQKAQNLSEIAGGISDAVNGVASLYGASGGSWGNWGARAAGQANQNAAQQQIASGINNTKSNYFTNKYLGNSRGPVGLNTDAELRAIRNKNLGR